MRVTQYASSRVLFLVRTRMYVMKSVLADDIRSREKDGPVENIRVHQARLRVRVSRLKNGYASVSSYRTAVYLRTRHPR